MKLTKNFLILFSLILTLKINGQNFIVNEHSIQINLNEILKPASRIQMINSLKYKNEYYSIFEETQMYNFGHTQKYFIKFDLNGKILKVENLPYKLSNGYYLDFFVFDNNIYIQLPDNSKYILNFTTNKFKETTKGNDIVYDDDNYKVMYKSFGEWGQATWFINKKDKSEYFTCLNGQDVNFLNDKFYITNISSIWEISNPKNLNKCEPKQNYDEINKKKFAMFTSYDYKKGIASIYNDSIQYYTHSLNSSINNFNNAFITSFVSNNRLFQVTQQKNKTAITEIIKNSIENRYNFNEKYNFFSWNNQFRNAKNNQKFLKFQNGYNSFGFFEIEDNKIDITKVNFKYDTIHYIKLDNITKLVSNLSTETKITRNKINEFEKLTNGIDIHKYQTNINHNGYYPRKFEKINIETTNFVKTENEYITQNIEYLFTKENEELQAIFIDYDKTKFFNSEGKNYFPIRSENKIESDIKFKEKYNQIKEELNRIGKQIKVKIKPNKMEYESWISNGWQFNLYEISKNDINGITLYICKQQDFNENE